MTTSSKSKPKSIPNWNWEKSPRARLVHNLFYEEGWLEPQKSVEEEEKILSRHDICYKLGTSVDEWRLRIYPTTLGRSNQTYGAYLEVNDPWNGQFESIENEPAKKRAETVLRLRNGYLDAYDWPAPIPCDRATGTYIRNPKMQRGEALATIKIGGLAKALYSTVAKSAHERQRLNLQMGTTPDMLGQSAIPKRMITGGRGENEFTAICPKCNETIISKFDYRCRHCGYTIKRIRHTRIGRRLTKK